MIPISKLLKKSKPHGSRLRELFREYICNFHLVQRWQEKTGSDRCSQNVCRFIMPCPQFSSKCWAPFAWILKYSDKDFPFSVSSQEKSMPISVRILVGREKYPKRTEISSSPMLPSRISHKTFIWWANSILSIEFSEILHIKHSLLSLDQLFEERNHLMFQEYNCHLQ